MLGIITLPGPDVQISDMQLMPVVLRQLLALQDFMHHEMIGPPEDATEALLETRAMAACQDE